MAAVDESNIDTAIMVDDMYEFSAPRFFDFVRGETEEDKCEAELWFETALTYAPSPCMPKIKTGRSFKVENLCDFNQAEETHKNAEQSGKNSVDTVEPTTSHPLIVPSETTEGSNPSALREQESTEKEASEKDNAETTRTCQDGRGTSSDGETEQKDCGQKGNLDSQVQNEACTPLPNLSTCKGKLQTKDASFKKQQTAKKIASMVKNPSALKPRCELQLSQPKRVKPNSVKRETNVKNTSETSSLAQENQAIKRQKLEGGLSRQILNVKPHNLPHKSKMGLKSGASNGCSSVADKTNKEERKIYVREPAPFVSMAEMMKKFQSGTRDLSLARVHSSHSHDGSASFTQMKPKLTLTRPKDPELETAQRVRSTKLKSSAELEEEMMAKIPKFKARPLNKKILEAPTLPAISRSTPHPPEFQEFHFETMNRAYHHADSASVISTESSRQNNRWKPRLTEPKTPVLHTLLRARPPRLKSSFEIELEELEKIPKFKARPLDKKIFESKGELGVFCNTKKHVTKPQEFHFATNERIPPPTAVADLFDKLSISSETRNENPIPRNTNPNPFHLYTEERGATKERKFFMQLVHKQLEEERATIPRANPYPYTTDYPVIPPKPEPKQCTKPEPFQLESLVRHEEEMQKEMEERKRIEEEEARTRSFKAQPILKEDPIPLPEKLRRPLTQVQEFNLHVDHRAVDRAEFDQKIKEKEMMYKRYREESEAEKMVEEEKALKQLRRTLVHHARPVPKFDQPFHPQKSFKETTKPKSPSLRVLQRKERRKLKVAMSSPAAQLR